ncbi:SpoIIE family protein phosphatase [Streptomyces fradiae]|uniref:Phosphoserine phosphatase RsbU n=2 Tax=Streptomyces fradiae ATCC 10745 = DSM 40063 TaxID=1319510 RepID=A0A1Y2NZK5_STRFR|nr:MULTISPECIES: ATP-binding SpoIIE family protein phosphatase [Streptomyces]OSY52631.1 Phosphoserine phosphatase RsbU [Streptomyces fradiae ATCC 10745 = DSM 40063]
MGERKKRPGRPWAPPKGASAEVISLVQMVRSWIDEAGLSVRDIHSRLTPEHFADGRVADLRRLRIHLSGEDLTWDVVEAVADVCFPDEPAHQALGRVREARALWDKAQSAPTLVAVDGQVVVSPRELIEEKERTIQVYRDLVRARQAYETSEQGRQQALRIASMLFLVLGQAQAKVAELSRRIDARTGVGVYSPDPTRALQPQLKRARDQEARLSAQLERAVSQRDEAQRIADLAARRVQMLEAYLLDIGQQPLVSDAGDLAVISADAVVHDVPGEDSALDQFDEILARTDDALDREQEAVRDAADDLGVVAEPHDSSDARIIAGSVFPHPRSSAGDSSPELFRTTLNNSYGLDDDVAVLRERLALAEKDRHKTAVSLQQSLLPKELEQPDDLRIAATYQPGDSDAGGDWYDVVSLGAGRTAFVIGDVMGRGVRAAAAMGQLRAAVRAYARLDLPPHEVIQLLDGLAAEIAASQIATCVYAVHDPHGGQLVYASAGHLPILVRDEDGTVRRAEDPTGAPLGTGGWRHASGSIGLPPGSTAVLYTDGLVERRDRDIDESVAVLERTLAGVQGTPGDICATLLRTLGADAYLEDDIAVLALQHPTRTGADAELFVHAALDLGGGVETAPRARRFARNTLASWRLPAGTCDLGVLAASELVANALQHGTPPVGLRLRRTDRRLIIEVTDADDHLPRRRQAGPADEAGRGMSVIAAIASSWGSRRDSGGGKAVWCELPLGG